jgi:hypothetical protein
MPNITTRATKGSALTHAELDANFTRTVTQVTTTYQILASDNRTVIEGNHASTPFTVTLPAVATAAAEDSGDFEVTVWNINAAVVSVDGSGRETINGSTAAITLGQWESVTVKLDSADAAWVTTSRVGDLGAVNGTFTGNLTGNVTGDVTGDVTGNLTGNVTGNSDTVTTNADLVGHVTSVGNTSTLTVASITGQSDIGGAIADTDELIINDGGAIRRTDMSRVRTYNGIAAQATNHIRAGNVQIYDGTTDATLAFLDVATDVTENAWETVGPTGSGATNIWADMDYLDSTATILIADALILAAPSGTGTMAAALYGASGDVASPPAGLEENMLMNIQIDHDAAITGSSGNSVRVQIPLGANQIFKVRWSAQSEQGLVVSLYYRGFMTD